MTPKNAQTNASLDALLRGAYNTLSTTERKLADVVIARQKDLLGYSATELASLAGVSKASAARFFRRLGFADFNAFRQHVRSLTPDPSPLSRIDHDRPGQPVLALAQKHLQEDALRLHQLRESLTDDLIRRALQLLGRARRVWVVGYRNSYMTAFYAHTLLSQVRPDVLLLNDPAGRETESLADLSARDVLLVVDFRRRTRRVEAVVAAAHTAHSQVLLLTDTQLSALATRAAVVLPCPGHQQQVFDSYVAAVSLVNYLATALAAQSRKQTRARMARIEDLHVLLNDLATDI